MFSWYNIVKISIKLFYVHSEIMIKQYLDLEVIEVIEYKKLKEMTLAEILLLEKKL